MVLRVVAPGANTAFVRQTRVGIARSSLVGKRVCHGDLDGFSRAGHPCHRMSCATLQPCHPTLPITRLRTLNACSQPERPRACSACDRSACAAGSQRGNCPDTKSEYGGVSLWRSWWTCHTAVKCGGTYRRLDPCSRSERPGPASAPVVMRHLILSHTLSIAVLPVPRVLLDSDASTCRTLR